MPKENSSSQEQRSNSHKEILIGLTASALATKGADIIGAIPVADGEYILRGAGGLEHGRLEHQNNLDWQSWGWGHREFHRNFSEKHNKSRIAEIGVGKDANLVINLIDLYKDAIITVIEINQEKVDAARENIAQKRPNNAARVNFISGDAAIVLTELAGKGENFDLIDMQCLLIHQKDEQIQNILRASKKALAENGHVVVIEPHMEEWSGQVKEGYENDPEVLVGAKAMHEFVHGNPQSGFKGALFFAWGARGAHPWKSEEEMVQHVTELGGLKHLPEYTFRHILPLSEANTSEEVLITSMAAVIPLAVTGASRVNPNLVPVAESLWESGRKYHEGAKKKGVLTKSTPLVANVYSA